MKLTMILATRFLAAYRTFWIGIGYVLGLFSILEGVGYALEGNAQVSSTSLYVLERIPGHMHTHGFLMMIIGFLLIVEMRSCEALHSWLEPRGWHWAEHLMFKIYCGYASVVSLTIFGSWYITGKITFAVPWFWIAFATIAGMMIMRPPPPLDVLRRAVALAAEERTGDRA